ncbi:hypothetical protein ACFFHM_23855 [Halalkalibacter kiskunsagensis]|uniref:Uncharacterized protein n=1 Tax=Halalkalibacter kiskunsagensis TaxID=1548599 RepID=A0ABV6KJL7_9BACI
MSQSINELSEWLESHKGETLLIKKGELATGLQQVFDIDEVTLQLEHITVVSNEKSIDDYMPSQELVLHGNGSIQSPEGEKPLPQNAYEIPLYGEVNTTNEKDCLKVETEKAVYDIHLH